MSAPYPDPPPSPATKRRIAELDAEMSAAFRSRDVQREWQLFCQIQHLLWGPTWREKFAEFVSDPATREYYRRWIT
jgi:hypothetical protein